MTQAKLLKVGSGSWLVYARRACSLGFSSDSYELQQLLAYDCEPATRIDAIRGRRIFSTDETALKARLPINAADNNAPKDKCVRRNLVRRAIRVTRPMYVFSRSLPVCKSWGRGIRTVRGQVTDRTVTC